MLVGLTQLTARNQTGSGSLTASLSAALLTPRRSLLTSTSQMLRDWFSQQVCRLLPALTTRTWNMLGKILDGPPKYWTFTSSRSLENKNIIIKRAGWENSRADFYVRQQPFGNKENGIDRYNPCLALPRGSQDSTGERLYLRKTACTANWKKKSKINADKNSHCRLHCKNLTLFSITRMAFNVTTVENFSAKMLNEISLKGRITFGTFCHF